MILRTIRVKRIAIHYRGIELFPRRIVYKTRNIANYYSPCTQIILNIKQRGPPPLVCRISIFFKHTQTL